MTFDPYEPTIWEFKLTPDEESAISYALETDKPWDVTQKPYFDGIKSFKTRIRDIHLARQGNTCCFCRCILHGGGYFMIDREHVLPKSKHKEITFSIWNISVACKRCNMQVKNECDEFYVGDLSESSKLTSDSYLIVHPNLDDWDDHLLRFAVQVGSDFLVKIRSVPDSAKGHYTYEYFDFDSLTKDSFDRAQGLSVRKERIASAIQALEAAFEQGG